MKTETSIQKIVYEKKFWLKENAISFIEKHKRQNCFTLRFKNLHWWVIKTKPMKMSDNA